MSGQEWEENQNLTGEHRSTLTETELAEEFTFYFRCNKSSIDEGYMTNGQEAEILRGMLGRTGFRVDTLTIYAYSSPEGPKKLVMMQKRVGNGRREEGHYQPFFASLPDNSIAYEA